MYPRLGLTLSENYVEMARVFCEKTTCIMTDAVSKNMDTEDGIAEILQSEYKSLHLLCIYDKVEALDQPNIEVLSRFENNSIFEMLRFQ